MVMIIMMIRRVPKLCVWARSKVMRSVAFRSEGLSTPHSSSCYKWYLKTIPSLVFTCVYQHYHPRVVPGGGVGIKKKIEWKTQGQNANKMEGLLVR